MATNDDELNNSSKKTKPSKVLKRFYVLDRKYEGYEIERTLTHIKIFDTFKKRNFELPISTTVVEDYND